MWPYTYGTKGRARLAWLLIGIGIVILPMSFPLKITFYYGLLGNATVFFWSADTYMGKEKRRARVLIGGVLVALLPVLWRWPLENWLGISLVPTLGHLAISGVAGGFILGVRRN